jgi:hypothetical protein
MRTMFLCPVVRVRGRGEARGEKSKEASMVPGKKRDLSETWGRK